MMMNVLGPGREEGWMRNVWSGQKLVLAFFKTLWLSLKCDNVTYTLHDHPAEDLQGKPDEFEDPLLTPA